MPPGDPDILVSRWGDGGLVWTIIISALAHVVVIAVLLVTPQRFLGAPPPLESYTVELVAPELIGGTNLVRARVGADEAPAAMPELPTVEPAPPAEPASPAAAKEPETIAPAPETEEAVHPEAVSEVIDEPEPAPQEEVKPEEPVAEPEAAAKVVGEEQPAPLEPVEPEAPAPSTEAEQNDNVGQSEEQVAAIAPPPVVPKPKAKERAKAEPNGAPKRQQEEKTKAVAKRKRKPSAAAKSGIDEKIAAAVQRRAEQLARRSAGETPSSAGGPIAYGSGSGAGGSLKGLDYIFYRRQMEERIKAAWAWAGAEASLQAVISFTITPSGRIINVRTVNSSGDPSYDASAERAVRAADPLSPPPEQYLFEFSAVELTFRPEDLRP